MPRRFPICRRHGCRVLRWPTSGLPQAWLPGGRMSGVPEADGRVSLLCSISITRVSADDRGRQVTRTLSERAAQGVQDKLHCAGSLPMAASDCLPVCFQQPVPTTLGTRNQTVSQSPARRRHVSGKALTRALACRTPRKNIVKPASLAGPVVGQRPWIGPHGPEQCGRARNPSSSPRATLGPVCLFIMLCPWPLTLWLQLQ
jgi:hypothetical protein